MQTSLISHFSSSRRRSGIAVAVLAVAALGLSGCAASDADGDTAKVTFQLDWVKNSQFAGGFTAEDAGYYASEGLNVEFLDGSDVASTAAVIAGGGADIGIVSNMARLADAIATGVDLVAVGALYQDSPAGLMTLPAKKINDIGDLAGLRIGSDEAGVNDLDTLFSVNGAKPDYQSVRVGYDAAPLFEGQIDAYYAYVNDQPVSYRLQGKEVNTVTFASLGFKSYAGLIVTTREYLDKHSDRVEGFVKASMRGWNDALADGKAAVELTVSDYGADLGLDKAVELAGFDILKTLVSNTYTEKNGILALDPDMIAGPMYDALKASGRTGLPDPKKAFDTSIVPRMAAELNK